MSELIDRLKKDHQMIAAALDQVKTFGVATVHGRRALTQAKTGLLAHLAHEDDKLYPVLRSAADKDARLKRQLEMFAKDMAEISSAALSFFAKYEQGGDGIEFARDFGKLTATLRSRITREEDVLYKEYDRVSA